MTCHHVVMSCAGIVASIIGIGGGELLIPFLLSLRVLPQVAASTSAVNSLLSTSSSLVHLLVDGYLPWRVVPWMVAIGALGGISGRKFGVWTSKNFGRPSVLVVLLIGLTSFSIVLFLYYLFAHKLEISLDSLC